MNCLRLLGRSVAAKEMIDDVKASISETFGVGFNHACVSQSFLVFGQISKDRGQYDQAIAYIERSLTMYVSLYVCMYVCM